jgi:metallo-beta-lactamase class B
MMKVHDSVIHPWNYVVTPFPVADHVYYVGNRWVGSYLLDSGKGLILIDCAMPQTLYLLLDGIRSLGYDPHDIRLLLISHAHYDHAGAAEALRRYTGAQLWLGRDDVPFIGHPELLLADPCNCPDFQVDACYEPGQPICLGRFSIRAEHTPGHTPGAHSFFFEDTANGQTVLCGMHGGLGFNTMSDAFLDSVHLPHSLRQDFLQGLERLREYPVQLAIGSHPSVFHMLERWQEHTPGVNPFADDGSTWRAGMEDRIAAFRKQFPDA